MGGVHQMNTNAPNLLWNTTGTLLAVPVNLPKSPITSMAGSETRTYNAKIEKRIMAFDVRC